MIKRYIICAICGKKREFTQGRLSTFCKDCWKKHPIEIKEFFRECRKNGELPISKVEHIVINGNGFGLGTDNAHIFKCVMCKNDFRYLGNCKTKKYCNECENYVIKGYKNPNKENLKNKIKKMFQTMKQWRI